MEDKFNVITSEPQKTRRHWWVICVAILVLSPILVIVGFIILMAVGQFLDSVGLAEPLNALFELH